MPMLQGGKRFNQFQNIKFKMKFPSELFVDACIPFDTQNHDFSDLCLMFQYLYNINEELKIRVQDVVN